MLRRALVAAVSCCAACAVPAAVAQSGAGVEVLPAIEQPATPPPPGPSLHVATAELAQSGADLRFVLRFDRAIPADEIDPEHGRALCIVLSPEKASRRRVCVSSRGGRLAATLAPIDAGGRALGPAHVLGRAAVRADGDVLTLRAPAGSLAVRLGRPVTWRVVLQWRDGGLCETEPDPLACLQVLPQQGEQRLETTAAAARPKPPTAAPTPLPAPSRARRSHLRLLATGDSMIQLVDDDLKAGLAQRRATVVRSDAHVSTGISNLARLDWLRRARRQASGFRPDVTVVFLGANDGFPMRTRSGARAGCCGDGWIAEYARRVESMMRSYSRGGRSLVYWMTLPTPNRPNFARVFKAVNAAIARAARRAGDGVRVIDLVPVLSPGGQFRQDGRQPDGIHLSYGGARIAASLVLDRLRLDHALPRRR